MSADLRRELASTISQTIRSAVKETMKATLGDSFRKAFEASIVPAFEAGTREMFSQMQEAYTAGVEVMKTENHKIAQHNREEANALRSEVASLKDTVASLEGKIANLCVSGVGVKVSDDVYETDFRQLFREGRLGESLELALEDKNVNSVLWVIRQQSQTAPHLVLGGLLDVSSELSILCTVQQLAADLAAREPEEGIRARLECLKEMIMYLVDDHLPGGDVSDVVSSTLGNLKSAEAKHTLVGAARTDMKMLCSILLSVF